MENETLFFLSIHFEPPSHCKLKSINDLPLSLFQIEFTDTRARCGRYMCASSHSFTHVRCYTLFTFYPAS